MNIAIISLGCPKNQVDADVFCHALIKAGHQTVADPEQADIIIVNTCGFIDSAKAEAIDTILSMAQLKEDGRLGKILVTGCLTQRYQQEILDELPEVDGMMGTGSYGDIVSAVEKVAAGQAYSHFTDINAPVEELPRVISTISRG